ncbi:MAG: transposase [Anaerolineales bacterium]|nr:transposase [Anaerolineales bacterium]
MKLIARVKLRTDKDQFGVLLQTMEYANKACNEISNNAWEAETFKQFDIHRLTYRDIRESYPLSAQVVVRCIAKVADAYKINRKVRRTFSKHGAIAYDSRILKWFIDKSEVSIWTVNGRQRIPFVCGERQYDLLQAQRGESDLCLIDGIFYLFASCDVETPDKIDASEYLGVDLGIVNIASDSDGNQHSGSQFLNIRNRRFRQRRRLQKKGTKSANRVRKRLSGREGRFATWLNHTISKQIVEVAQRTGRGIALENLKGIRNRVRARREQRRNLHSWSFHQLTQFISYKAELAGVPIVMLDPAYSSQTCSSCGHVSKSNRKYQSAFLCQSCGYADHADTNAARNLSRWAVCKPAKRLINSGKAPPLAAG